MAIAIIIIILTLLLLYIIFKPYFVKYDTTLLFTGGLGTGKTLNGVKTGYKIYKKALFDVKLHNWWTKQKNKIRTKHNNKVNKRINLGKKKTGKLWKIEELQEIPRFITNIPVRLKRKTLKKPEKWSTVLTREMLLFQERIPEYSVVLIDETPQMVNQFNWNINEVQYTVNEIITFWRHYIGGKLILTAQADSEIVKQIRSKMNTYYHLSNFRKFLFFFYKCDICQFIASEVVDNVSTGFYEDNTKTIYGTLFKKLYDSRCYRERYNKVQNKNYKVWSKFTTNKIIRFAKYDSPLDTKENNK